MASTILYKFRSGTTFEALPLPGSAARLFDVKKAIVKAKKLDAGGMEFDLAVRNAVTQEEYVDESMILPRGTRLIVQRLPAARGHGFLARMARNEHGGTATGSMNSGASAAPSGFYTIDSRARDDEDEFVQTSSGPEQSSVIANEEKELAALQAVTSLRPTDGPAMMGGYSGGRGGPPPPAGMGRGGGPGHNSNAAHKPSYRPNADPELREQERKLMPKKRATGIPRTFLNLSAPPQTDGTKTDGEHDNVPLLQPNTLGFEELVNRGGGLSETIAGTRKDLDYALKLTATTVPDYLQCGICHSVVKNAVLLLWDPEGRTTCESCIRDALTQNGFRCPLTGMDGVSPDDLHPNVGLRKAADLFIKGVMEKIDEIEKQQVEDADENIVEGTSEDKTNDILEGDGAEKGVILSKKTTLAVRKKTVDDDPFGGGDDEFGGDVFAVDVVKPTEEEAATEKTAAAPGTEGDNEEEKASDNVESTEKKEESETKNTPIEQPVEHKIIPAPESKSKVQEENNRKAPDAQAVNELARQTSDARSSDNQSDYQSQGGYNKDHESSNNNHRDRRENRRRGPPVGYAMGPAGGAIGGPHGRHDRNGMSHGDSNGSHSNGSGGRGYDNFGRGNGGYSEGYNNDRGRGRGRGGRGRFGGRSDRDGGRGLYQQGGDGYGQFGGGDTSSHNQRRVEEHDPRGTKRSWDDHSRNNHSHNDHHRFGNYPPGGGRGFDDGRGRGGFRGRGRFMGRGGGGYRGGHRGGRGRY